MNRLLLITRIAGERIALPADTVQSVIELDGVTPVPLAPRHVAGLAALRSRVLTVIDSYAAIGVEQPALTSAPQAAVVTIDGHLYGVLVDEVEDVVDHAGDLLPLRSGIAPGWAAVADGFVEHDGAAMLMCDPARLVCPPADTVAAR